LRPNDRLFSDPTIACIAMSYFHTNKISHKAIIIRALPILVFADTDFFGRYGYRYSL